MCAIIKLIIRMKKSKKKIVTKIKLKYPNLI